MVVSFRISKRIKKKMDALRYINWSEVVRKAIEDVIAREESRRRKKDLDRMRRAALKSEELSRKVPGWNSVEEIRRWRERR